MTPLHPRQLLGLLLAAAGFTHLFAQVSKPFTPGTRIPIERCERVAMKATTSGCLDIIAAPAAQDRLMGRTDRPVPSDVEIPDNMRYWLECVEEGARYAEQHPGVQLGTKQEASSSVVRPLLGAIEWDQGAPYNSLCPAGTPVGCVATAMAQVMRYWRYPEQGIGEHTWRWQGVTHSVDFGATTYQWNLMLPSYNYSATAEQQAEAAKLSYHCGVAVDMMYDAEGSGSWGERVAGAMHKYFGYNDRAGFVYRTSYSYDDWNQMLRRELEAGRPILFTANNDESGHAFVIDGIDADGLYHVNWGWGGWYNGFFDICILNPYGAGIGAVASEVGFCMGQGAVIQICPDNGVGDLISPVCSSGCWGNSNEWAFVLSSYYENATGDTLRGVSGIEVLDAEGSHVSYAMGDTITLYPYSTYDRRNDRYYFEWTNTYVYASDFADGDYTARLCFQQFSSDTITYPLQVNYNFNPRYYFSVLDGQLTAAYAQPDKANILAGRNFSLQGQELATGKEYVATIEVENQGYDAFSGLIMLLVPDPTSSDNSPRTFSDPNFNAFIPAGGTYTAHIPIVLENEQQDITATLYGYNVPMDHEVSNCSMDIPISFSSRFTEESPARLSLIDDVQLLTERCEVDGEVAFQFVISNMGGKFSNHLGMRFYTSKAATGTPAFTIGQNVEVAMGTEVDSIIVRDILTEAQGMKKYYARPFYRDDYGDDQLLKFSASDGMESTPAPIEVRVYNATGIETVTADPADPAAPRYDLFGRPLPADARPRLFIESRRAHVVSE